jgi:hypothetical protein
MFQVGGRVYRPSRKNSYHRPRVVHAVLDNGYILVEDSRGQVKLITRPECLRKVENGSTKGS